MKQLADNIRTTVDELNTVVRKLENLLRSARENDMEVELVDGINAEISHDFDGLSSCKLKVIKISIKTPL